MDRSTILGTLRGGWQICVGIHDYLLVSSTLTKILGFGLDATGFQLACKSFSTPFIHLVPDIVLSDIP